MLCSAKLWSRHVLQKSFFLLAVGLGWLIAYLDSRPSWDDTGITAGLIFLMCVVCTVLFPQRPWLWAFAVGLWDPVVAIMTIQNYAACLALAVAFAGAYAGKLLRICLAPIPTARRWRLNSGSSNES
jgi:hypothetical protein